MAYIIEADEDMIFVYEPETVILLPQLGCGAKQIKVVNMSGGKVYVETPTPEIIKGD